jgi:hypothetical protein
MATQMVPIMQLRPNIPPHSAKFIQENYGTSSFPMWNWVHMVQTGEREFDPESEEDQEFLDEYNQLVAKYGQPPGMSPTQQFFSDVGAPVAGTVAQNIFKAWKDPIFATEDPTDKIMAGVKSSFGMGDLPSDIRTKAHDTLISQLKDQTIPEGYIAHPGLLSKATARAYGVLPVYDKLNPVERGKEGIITPTSKKISIIKGSKGEGFFDSPTPDAKVYHQDSFTPEIRAQLNKANMNLGGDPVELDIKNAFELDDYGEMGNVPEPTYLPEEIPGAVTAETPIESGLLSGDNLKSAGVNAAANFGVQLLAGKDPLKAAVSSGASAIGSMVGNYMLPGIGGFIGGALGGMLGGRVICNELHRQGFLERRQVILDYKFTREHLTPKHVKGYHVWATHVVRKLREGKQISLWRHMAIHRAREIEYIYGERDKPDYLGKIYRHVGEPICWVLGNFCKETDWSVLYQPKEI